MALSSLPPFLVKLQAITKTCDSSVAGWSDDGQQFVVKQSERFERDVLKKHFKGNKSTFIRQLHFYEFKKHDNKGTSWAFEHPKFRRDAPYMVYEIKRKTRLETPGPASREEVQMLRTEALELREQVDMMQQQIDELTGQMERLMSIAGQAPGSFIQHQSQQQQHEPSMVWASASIELYHKQKKLKSHDSDDVDGYSPNSSGFNGMLPFEDNSHSNLYRADSNMGMDSPSVTDDTVKKEDFYGELDINAINDFGDLFTFEQQALATQLQQEAAPTLLKQQQQQQQYQPSAAANRGGISMADYTASNTSVFLRSASKEVHMPNAVFAGFISKFIEHARMLGSRDMLFGDVDPELEFFVHNSLPDGSALKDLLSYGPPSVRTVLVNVLNDLNFANWQGDLETPLPMDSPDRQLSFPHRSLLIFKLNNVVKKTMTGECFLSFLSFLIRAAVQVMNGASPPSTQQKSAFLAAFQQHFSPEVIKVLCLASSQIEVARKEAQCASASAAATGHGQSSSSSSS